jgi:hypothetical protein
VLQPQAVSSLQTSLADIEVMDGVAVTVAVPVEAKVYDFGVGARGRLRLMTTLPSSAPRVIRVRFATDRNELDKVEGGVSTFTLAAGEQAVVDPEVRVFRYAEVFGSSARVDVVQ